MGISVTEARAKLPELISRAEAGEEITLLKHGKPVARLMPIDIQRPMNVSVEYLVGQLEDGMRRAKERIDAGDMELPGEGLSAEQAEEIVQWIREGRDAR